MIQKNKIWCFAHERVSTRRAVVSRSHDSGGRSGSMALLFSDEEIQQAWTELDEPQLDGGWELFTETMNVKIYRLYNKVNTGRTTRRARASKATRLLLYNISQPYTQHTLSVYSLRWLFWLLLLAKLPRKMLKGHTFFCVEHTVRNIDNNNNDDDICDL